MAAKNASPGKGKAPKARDIKGGSREASTVKGGRTQAQDIPVVKTVDKSSTR